MARVKKFYKNGVEYLLGVDAYSKTETDGLLSNKADTTAIPTKVSDLENDEEYLTSDTLTGDDVKSALGFTPANTTDLKNSKIQIKDSAGTVLGDFTLNQSSAKDVTIPNASNTALGLVKVDTALSTTSTNPVQNSVITQAINSMTSISFNTDYTSFSQLPNPGQNGVIYLIPNSGKGSNVKDEYIRVGGAYELLGTTETDLSNYVTLNSAQSITGVKTFTQEIVVKSKNSTPTNTSTAVATEAQVYNTNQTVSKKAEQDLITQNEYNDLSGKTTDGIFHLIYE